MRRIVAGILLLMFTSTLIPAPIEIQASQSYLPQAYHVQLTPPKDMLVTPGTKEILNFVVKNAGTENDTYDWRATQTHAVGVPDWNLTNSMGRTKNLTSGETYTISITVTVPADAKDTHWHNISVTVYSQAKSGLSVSARTYLEVRFVAGVKVSAPLGQTAKPGSTISYNFLITNTGNGEDWFRLIVTSTHGWASVSTEKTSPIDAGSSTTVTVSVKIPALNLATMVQDNTYANATDTVGLIAISEKDKATSASNITTTTVGLVYGVKLSASPDKIGVPYAEANNERLNVTFLVTVTSLVNERYPGGGTMRIDLRTDEKPYPGWMAYVDPSTVTLSAGQYANVLLRVRAAPYENAGHYTITLTAKPHAPDASDASVVVSVNVEQIYGVDVRAPPDQSGVFTQAVVYDFIIENTGNGADSFAVFAYSEKGWNVTLSQRLISGLASKSRTTVQATVVIPDDVKPGTTDTLTIAAFSLGNSSVFDKDSVVTTVIELLRIRLASKPGYQDTGPAETVSFELVAVNNGTDAELTMRWEAIGGLENWVAGWEPPNDPQTYETLITARETKVVKFLVTAPTFPSRHETKRFKIFATVTGSYERERKNTTEIEITVTVRSLFIAEKKIVDADIGATVNFTVRVINIDERRQWNRIRLEALGIPSNWTAKFYDTVAGIGRNETEPLSPYAEANFRLTLFLPADAPENITTNLLIRALVTAGPGWTYLDSESVEIHTVGLDLAITAVRLPKFIEGRTAVLNVTVSAGTLDINGFLRGYTKDATNVRLRLYIGDTKVLDVPVGRIVRDTSVSVNLLWNVPMLPWYKKSERNSMTIEVTTTTSELPDTRSNNFWNAEVMNGKAGGIEIVDATFELWLTSILLIIFAAMIIGIVIAYNHIRVREKVVMRWIRAILFPAICGCIALIFALIFVLPADLMQNELAIVLLIIMFGFEFPALAHLTAQHTKSHIVSAITGAILIPLFFTIVAAASGNMGYLIPLMFGIADAPLNVPFIVWTVVFTFVGPISWLITYRLLLYARREIARTEHMIQYARRMI